MIRELVVLSAALPLIMASCEKAENYTDPAGPRYSGEYSDNHAAATDSITVVSYNIQHALRIEQSIKDIEADEKTKNADLILLQEMDYDGVERIASRLKYNYIYYPACIQANYGKNFGNAILSKWPMGDFRKVVLPHEDPRHKQKRIAVLSVIEIGDREILACSVHTEFIQFPVKKIDQVRYLAESIVASQDHVIIGGDFNTFLKYTLDSFDFILKEAGFSRATESIGWTAGVDPFRFPRFDIDHIYTRGFEALESGKSTAAKASDHIPIWTTLKFK
jgi:endonuclease/exonuclease/phosphatase family metal-dependent hydrolase